jgi:hypothetical protein
MARDRKEYTGEEAIAELERMRNYQRTYKRERYAALRAKELEYNLGIVAAEQRAKCEALSAESKAERPARDRELAAFAREVGIPAMHQVADEWRREGKPEEEIRALLGDLPPKPAT